MLPRSSLIAAGPTPNFHGGTGRREPPPMLAPMLSPKLFPLEYMRRNLTRRHRVVTRQGGAYSRGMASSRGYGRRGTSRLADMSLPADQRCARKTTRTSRKPVPAQMDHGSSPAGRRRRRDGERKMRQARRLPRRPFPPRPRPGPGLPAPGILGADVRGTPLAGSPPDQPPARAPRAFPERPGEHGPADLAGAPARAVADAGVQPQRRAVGGGQPEGGQDQAGDAPGGEGEQQDPGQDPGEPRSAHARRMSSTPAGSPILILWQQSGLVPGSSGEHAAWMAPSGPVIAPYPPGPIPPQRWPQWKQSHSKFGVVIRL